MLAIAARSPSAFLSAGSQRRGITVGVARCSRISRRNTDGRSPVANSGLASQSLIAASICRQPVVAAETDRQIAAGLGAEPPANRKLCGDLLVSQVAGPGEHAANVPCLGDSAQNESATNRPLGRVNVGTC
jgi:hypothetical protein